MTFINKNKKNENIFDMSNITGERIGNQINSGVEGAEKELEDLSFVKKTGAKDRSQDDPFARLGL
jgi:hypothetical protein